MELDRLSMAWIRLGSMKDHNRHQWVHVMPFWFDRGKGGHAAAKRRQLRAAAWAHNRESWQKLGTKARGRATGASRTGRENRNSAIMAEGM